jgi:CRISPR/Cas system-associated exonuclease Cas4 (RecB family)
MTLPPDLQFSQAALQDYVDCPRRFQLRYVQRLAWPALEVEPPLESERCLLLGAAFHRLLHQHALGISEEQLSRAAADKDLRRWWRNYRERPLANLPASRYPEVPLSAPVGGYRVIAKYDLVAVEPGERAVIVDWKTSRKRRRRGWWADRLQTRVYPYLLVRAGAHLNGGRSLRPEQVELVYWFASFPSDPERFTYTTAQHEADDAYLASLVEEIAALGDEEFPLTTRREHCRRCSYRSLCGRGVEAGPFDELEDEPEPGADFGVDPDLEQIAEVEY